MCDYNENVTGLRHRRNRSRLEITELLIELTEKQYQFYKILKSNTGIYKYVKSNKNN